MCILRKVCTVPNIPRSRLGVVYVVNTVELKYFSVPDSLVYSPHIVLLSRHTRWHRLQAVYRRQTLEVLCVEHHKGEQLGRCQSANTFETVGQKCCPAADCRVYGLAFALFSRHARWRRLPIY